MRAVHVPVPVALAVAVISKRTQFANVAAVPGSPRPAAPDSLLRTCTKPAPDVSVQLPVWPAPVPGLATTKVAEVNVTPAGGVILTQRAVSFDAGAIVLRTSAVKTCEPIAG